MSKPTTKMLVPKLRFPEFQDAGEWKETQLKQLAKRIKLKNKEGKESRVLTNSAEYGVVDQRAYFDKDIANKGNLGGYFIVEYGDYVYNPRVSIIAPVGPISKNNIGIGVMSPLYTVFRFNNSMNAFYEHYFRSTQWHKYLREVSNSGARHDRMSITIDDFMDMPLSAPCPEEQQKIADCLSSIDELITTHTQKHEALKAHKKGLMQQLFPTEGETVPKLRFPEFLDAGEWEVKAFEKVFARITSKNKENNQNVLTISAQMGLVSQLEYFNKKVAAKDVSGYYLLHKGDFAYNKSYSQGYPMGAFKPLKDYDKGVVSTLYICFRVKSGYKESFFEQYFDAGVINCEIEKIAQEGARNHGLLNISVTEFFEDVRVFVPQPNEQQKIADCLSSVDEQITAQAQKIDALKAHKKSLMQQLFPSVDEVNG